jgi:hypothetical protein
MTQKSFILTVTADCQTYTPTITLDVNKFPSQSYTLEGTAVTLTVDTTLDLTTSVALTACGDYTIEFLYADGTALTGDPFTFTTPTLSIYSTDATKIGTHNLLLQVYLTSYPQFRSNILPIEVTIVGTTCALGSASFIPDYYYDRALDETQSFTFQPFFNPSASCGNVWVYEAYLVDSSNDALSGD